MRCALIHFSRHRFHWVMSRLGPFGVVGRLKPGISQRQAQSQLETLAAQRGAGKPIAAEGNYVRPWPVLISLTDAARQSHASLPICCSGL